MPRPPKKPEDRKSYHLRTPLTEAQRQLIEAASNLEDRDLAAWSRAILLDAAKRTISKHARQKGDDKA
jgi:uncharacterized protein (DUF1778 family)